MPTDKEPPKINKLNPENLQNNPFSESNDRKAEVLIAAVIFTVIICAAFAVLL